MPDEAALHHRIAQAHRAGELEIEVDFRAVNRSGAPGFRTTDIIVPPFVILVLSAYAFLGIGVWAGAAALLAGVGLFLLAIRPRIRQRTEDRTRELALATLEDWTVLWRLGGLSLRLIRDRASACIAPAGDWRAFACDHLLDGPAADGGRR